MYPENTSTLRRRHAYSLLQRSVIAEVDLNPLQPPTPFATIDRFELLDTYVAMKYAGLDWSIGKQEPVVGARRRWRAAHEQQRHSPLDGPTQ